MRYDLHIHTKRSICSNLEPDLILKIAKKKNLDGIAITDHNTIKGSLDVSKLNKDKDFEIISGAEIRTNFGDVLCYYIQEEIKSREFFGVINEVKKQDGLIAIAHPFRMIPWLRFHYPIEKVKDQIDAIEVFNSRMMPGDNNRAKKVAEELKIPQIGGSDAHFWFDIGRGYTIFNSDLRKSIKHDKTNAHGSILMGIISGTLSSFQSRVIKKVSQ
jgi:predicted metal-dependent phosphoesterase TrpH